jgi:hypothetical protein
MDEKHIERAIELGDRSLAGTTAPACGLTLLSVRYENPFIDTLQSWGKNVSASGSLD